MPPDPDLINFPWRRLTSLRWLEQDNPKSDIFFGGRPEFERSRAFFGEYFGDDDVLHQRDSELLVAGQGARWREVKPLKDPHLWEKFAKEDASRPQVLRLCQTYGFLQRNIRYTHSPLPNNNPEAQELEPTRGPIDRVPEDSELGAIWPPTPPSEDLEVFTETYTFWRSEMRLLYLANKLHEALQLGDLPSALVLWPKLPREFPPLTREEVRDGEQQAAQDFANFRPQQDSTAAPPISLQRCQDRLQELLQCRAQKVQVAYVYTAPGKLELQLTPPDLLSALWMQLALKLSQVKAVRRCIHCQTVLTIGPRQHCTRKYCNDTCRQRALRSRRAALKL
ncbi:hypothetical protein E7T06_05255 [Deinococcus sp. Arct2-2]|uniref:hypothetical protein n=1 Tax=Deinococcus sp. Arct2-2 TaxID=2568653 RepID=UPI0010A3C641|nr:hypothetical protein [Deinococcus sp. Arct2-2]THF70964.1 hypothetical protein E7T06_05255 [Deinococcus sp. Arct2-2]